MTRLSDSGASRSSSDLPEGAEAVAHYLADITSQLETMARGAQLELLAYLLAMARAEAETLARGGARGS